MEGKRSGKLRKSLIALLVMGSVPGQSGGAADGDGHPAFKIGDRLPDAGLMASGSRPVGLTDPKRRVRLISIVPQLNTGLR